MTSQFSPSSQCFKLAPIKPSIVTSEAQATDGAERAADVIFKINDFLDTTKLGGTSQAGSSAIVENAGLRDERMWRIPDLWTTGC